MMNRRRRRDRRPMLRPPLDHHHLAWRGVEHDTRLITLRDLVQFVAVVVVGYGALWIAHAIVRWLFP